MHSLYDRNPSHILWNRPDSANNEDNKGRRQQTYGSERGTAIHENVITTTDDVDVNSYVEICIVIVYQQQVKLMKSSEGEAVSVKWWITSMCEGKHNPTSLKYVDVINEIVC